MVAINILNLKIQEEIQSISKILAIINCFLNEILKIKHNH